MVLPEVPAPPPKRRLREEVKLPNLWRALKAVLKMALKRKAHYTHFGG